MPYYIAPYIGTGTILDPFRPLGSDQPGWSAIDLRLDGGATLGGGGLNACFLHLPVANPDPSLILVALDPADTIGSLLRQAIATRLKLLTPPISTRWDDLAMELLLGPPPNGWKALQTTVDRMYEVWLGGLLKRLPVISGGASASDNFNRANESPLAGNWVVNPGANTVDLVNNAVTKGAAGTEYMYWSATTFTTDHFAECKNPTTVNFDYVSPTVRSKKAAGSLETYELFLEGGNDERIRKWVAGALTNLLSMSFTYVQASDVLRVDANGSTITAYLNGVSKGSVTDTSLTTGTPGLGHGGGELSTLDDWAAGDLVVATSKASPAIGRGLAGW